MSRSHPRLFAFAWAMLNSGYAISALFASQHAPLLFLLLVYNALPALLGSAAVIPLRRALVPCFQDLLHKRRWLWVLIAGLLWVVMDFFFLTSLSRGQPIESYMLFSSWPLWYYVANWLFKGRHASHFFSQFVTIILGFAGVLTLLIGSPTRPQPFSISLSGFALVGALCAAMYNAVLLHAMRSMQAERKHSDVAIATTVTICVNAIGTIVVALILWRHSAYNLLLLRHLQVGSWILFGPLYVGVLVNGVGQVFAFIAQQAEAKVNIATIAFLSPVISASWLSLFTGASLSTTAALGAVIIVLAAFVSQNDLSTIKCESGAILVLGVSLMISVFFKQPGKAVVSFDTISVMVAGFGVLAAVLSGRLQSRRASYRDTVIDIFRTLSNLHGNGLLTHKSLEHAQVDEISHAMRSAIELARADGGIQEQDAKFEALLSSFRRLRVTENENSFGNEEWRHALRALDKLVLLHTAITSSHENAAFYLICSATVVVTMFAGQGTVFDVVISVVFATALSYFALNIRDEMNAPLLSKKAGAIGSFFEDAALNLWRPHVLRPVTEDAAETDDTDGWTLVFCLAVVVLVVSFKFGR